MEKKPNVVFTALQLEQQKEGKNVPLYHGQIKDMNERHYFHQFPNRASRRDAKQGFSGGNRKHTRGRHIQLVDVMMQQGSFKGLPLMVPTGYKRRINHRPVLSASITSRAAVVDKIFTKREREEKTHDLGPSIQVEGYKSR